MIDKLPTSTGWLAGFLNHQEVFLFRVCLHWNHGWLGSGLLFLKLPGIETERFGNENDAAFLAFLVILAFGTSFLIHFDHIDLHFQSCQSRNKHKKRKPIVFAFPSKETFHNRNPFKHIFFVCGLTNIVACRSF